MVVVILGAILVALRSLLVRQWRIFINIGSITTILLLLFLSLYPSSLCALFTKVSATATVVLPLVQRTYEGIERTYLGPPKCGLGFTQTSNS